MAKRRHATKRKTTQRRKRRTSRASQMNYDSSPYTSSYSPTTVTPVDMGGDSEGSGDDGMMMFLGVVILIVIIVVVVMMSGGGASSGTTMAATTTGAPSGMSGAAMFGIGLVVVIVIGLVVFGADRRKNEGKLLAGITEKFGATRAFFVDSYGRLIAVIRDRFGKEKAVELKGDTPEQIAAVLETTVKNTIPNGNPSQITPEQKIYENLG